MGQLGKSETTWLFHLRMSFVFRCDMVLSLPLLKKKDAEVLEVHCEICTDDVIFGMLGLGLGGGR